MNTAHFRRLSLLLALSQLVPLAALAQQPPASAMASKELDELRGGYATVDGLTFDFSANVRVQVDGREVLESRMTLTPDGLASDIAQTQAPGVSFLPDGAGVSIADDTGKTTVLNRLASGDIQGVIINTGNDRNIRQDVDVQLTLPGFDIVQRNIDVSRLASALGTDLALAQTAGR